MNNRSKKLLFDVLTAGQEIISFLAGKTRHEYMNNVLLRRGVERNLEIIGEALGRLRAVDTSTFERIPDGSQIVAMRNRLIHVYAQVNDDIVWDTARHDIPKLHRLIHQILDESSPDA